VDGSVADWSGIAATTVTLEQIAPIPGEEWGEVAPIDVDLRVAADSSNIYVLMEVFDDYDYVADDHGLSAALGVMFLIDPTAAPHMGSEEDDLETSLGMVDIWHWELDCGPGELSGGNDAPSGNDPDCNLDDEYSTTPEEREDDGTAQAENSLAGVWEHTARAQGQGADGTWIFEMSRPLNTGDPEDAQLSLGGTAQIALAYWDADENPDGWSDAGHLTSANSGWIKVSLP
ncbi:MAG: ethylbenzene dehydrogenase-related protein, partial [Dehalococcoidia bacterium]